nr:hypothetical protein [Tanacetum cinerariifolium]
MSYLSDFNEINRGYVTFGRGEISGRITGKETIKTGNLDFEDVYFVKELMFNLFSISQMCDRKNNLLFTDTECLVLSPNFKLPDETKDETTCILKKFIIDIENLVDKKVKNRVLVVKPHNKTLYELFRCRMPLFPSMLVIQEEEGKGSRHPSEPQPPPSTAQHTNEEPIPDVASSSHQKTQTPRQALNKDDRVERAATITTSLDTEQASGKINRTQSTIMPNVPIPQGIGAGGSPRCQEAIGGSIAHTKSKRSNDPPLSRGHTLRSREDSIKLIKELIKTCTKLSERVLALEESKTAQDLVITRLKLRVRKLEKKNKKARTPQPMKRRLFKVRVESSAKENLDEEDPSKYAQGEAHCQEYQPKDQLGVLSEDKVLAYAARKNVQTYTRRRRVISTDSVGISTPSRLFSTVEESVSTAGASMPVSTAGMVQRVNISIPSLVAVKDKERFNSTEPTDDKERTLWVELKRLFKPYTDDKLWKLQRERNRYFHVGRERISIVKRDSDFDTIKALRSDRRGEYLSQEFLEHLRSRGIVSQRTHPYTRQHNGVSKRRNRTLLDMGGEALVKQDTLNKLESKSIKCIFVGYPKETMGYYIYYPPKNKFFAARQNAQPSENTSEHQPEAEHDDVEPKTYVNPIYRFARIPQAPERYDFYIDVEKHVLGDHGEPTNYRVTLLDPKFDKWLKAMNAKMQSMKDNQVWTLVDLPSNCKMLVSKWLFKKKTDMHGNIHTYKARLVVKGFTQTYEVDYEETFSPIADIKAIRILIAIAAFCDYDIWKMDVKTAFLNGRLNKDQASRSYNKRFDEEIKKYGFNQNLNEPCVYMRASGSIVVFLILYVDDLLLMGNNILMLQDVKSWLGKCFSMKDLGEVAYIQGIKIYRDRSMRLIGLSQNAYIDKILKQFKMDASKRGSLPMQPNVDLSKTQGPSTPVEICFLLMVVIPQLSLVLLTTLTLVGRKIEMTFDLRQEAEYIVASEAVMEAIWIRKFTSRIGMVPSNDRPMDMYCDNTGAITIADEPGV